MSLTEAVARFRSLAEAKVGDYVTAIDGSGGYVQVVNGRQVTYAWSDHNSGHQRTVDAGKLTVNPDGDPAVG